MNEQLMYEALVREALYEVVSKGKKREQQKAVASKTGMSKSELRKSREGWKPELPKLRGDHPTIIKNPGAPDDSYSLPGRHKVRREAGLSKVPTKWSERKRKSVVPGVSSQKTKSQVDRQYRDIVKQVSRVAGRIGSR